MAAGCEFFPAYSVLRTALVTWNEQHQARLRPRIAHSDAFQLWMDEQENNAIHRQRVADRAATIEDSWHNTEALRVHVQKIKDLWTQSPALGTVNARVLVTALRRNAPENLAHLPAAWLTLQPPDEPKHQGCDR